MPNLFILEIISNLLKYENLEMLIKREIK